MAALICGSLAYDTIMVFEDQFKNHILPDQVHILNISFLVPQMRREFGGCAGNISYNLKLLGGDPAPMATVGKDFGPYEERLKGLNISQRYVRTLEDKYTAQAFITTDKDDNQITAFHPGAMDESFRNQVRDTADIEIGIVAPDGRAAMIQHATQFNEIGIPFIFDPGQALPLFDGDDFRTFVKQATWVAANDYESRLMQERTGMSVQEIASQLSGYFVTRGKKGSLIHTSEGTIEIPAVSVNNVADPTGCGDAYRAGLLWGLTNDLDLETTGKLAALMGGIKIESAGTQNHRFTQDYVRERFRSSFGHDF